MTSKLLLRNGVTRHAFIFVLACFFSFKGLSQTTVTYTTSGTGTFTVPPGVTSITVEVWGAGGRGGGRTNGNPALAGGGGGAYSKSTLAVTPFSSYTVYVGAGSTTTFAGEDSYFGSTSTVMAKGGESVATNTNIPGAGGLASDGVGDVKFSGGSGATGTQGSIGGGGGSSAGSAANGNYTTTQNTQTGATAPTNGGNGGTGANTTTAGIAGSEPGGGGGGGIRTTGGGGTTRTPGNGAAGRVAVTYTLPGGSPIVYYSKASSNWNVASTWTTSPSHAGADASTAPTTGDVVVISGHTISTNSGNRSCLDLYMFGAGRLDLNQNGNTVTVSGNLTMDGTSRVSGDGATRILNVGGNLSVPATATNARIEGETVTITGLTNISGTLVLNDATGIKTFTGAVTINSGGSMTETAAVQLAFGSDVTITGTLTESGAAIVDIAGSLTNNGTYTASTGTHTFSGATKTLSGSSAISIPTATFTGNYSNNGTLTSATLLTVTGAGVVLTNNGTMTATTSLTGTGGVTQGTTGTLNLGGTATITALTTSATGNTVNYTGGAQTVLGIDYYNLTLSGSNTKTLQSSCTINNSLTFSAATLLSINSSSNLTLAAAATVTGAASDRYVQVDGVSGTGSNLIKVNNGTAASWQFTFPIGTSSGGYTPLTIPTITTAPDAGSTLAVKAIYGGSTVGQLLRTFQLIIAGNDNGTTFSNAVFSYNDATDILSGDSELLYSTFRSESGSMSSVPGSVNTTSNTFTVTGGTALTATLNSGTYSYMLGTAAGKVWYTYQTGDYSNFNTWTLDPSGTTFDNGLNLIPVTGDEIHILNGYTVTVNAANKILYATEIKAGGILNVTTTGHHLGTVTGSGLLRVNSTNLPTGTYTDFVSSSGGTIEYYDVGGTLSTTQTTYNHLKFTNSGASSSAITFIQASDLIVNGTFTIGLSTGSSTATWQINDNSNTQRTITLNGDLIVNLRGAITAGTGNSGSTTPHNLTLYGNLTNNGVVRFFDPAATPFTSAFTSQTVLVTAGIQGNAVNVTFSGTTAQTVTCNSQTDFYRFIVDKGTSQQPILTVYSPDASFTSANNIAPYNLRLWAPADQATTVTGSSNNALSIKNGTLKLTGTVNIPTLAEGNNNDGSGTYIFPIPLSGGLWLSGAGGAATATTGVNVTLTSGVMGKNTTYNNDQRLSVNGLLRVSDGASFDGGFSRGINSYAGGSVIIEGTNTVVTIWQYRPIAGGSGVFTYQQTGGTLNVGTTGYNGTPATAGADDGVNNTNGATDSYARFSLGNTNSSFQMSGGTINIGSPTTANPDKGALAGGLDIQSLPANYNVTGGTINMYIPLNASPTSPSTNPSPLSGGHNFSIYSTAPLGNVNIYREGTTGSFTATLNGALTVLNNLTIDGTNTPTLIGNNNNLTIGGNFTIGNGATFTPAAVGAGGLTGTLTQSSENVTGGSNGTYTNVAPSSTTGVGTGALFTITIGGNNGNRTVTIDAITNTGSGYQTGDNITFNGSLFNGGNGSAVYSIAAGNVASAPASTSTLTFNGSGTQTWAYGSAATGNAPVITNLNAVVVNKSAGTLSLSFPRTGTTALPNISTLTLTSGTFNDGGSTVTVTTALTNNATHTSTSTGNINYSAVGGTLGGNNGTFGNLILSGSNSVTTMSGNQTVTGDLRMTGTGAAATPLILNIGSNSLRVNGAISTAASGTTAAFDHNVHILTSGLHNAGGLTRPVTTANTDVLFPLGTLVVSSTAITTSTNRQYTPNTINVNSATTLGTITVRPVSNTHPNVTATTASLAYYWRVTSSGFVGTGTVTHKTYQFDDGIGNAPTAGGTANQYVAARYDRSNNTWGYFIGSGTAAAPTTQTMVQTHPTVSTILPTSFNTASASPSAWTGLTGSQLDGEYTCGLRTAFGTVTTYYSRTGTSASPAAWNANATWSTDAVNKHTGAAATSNPTSCTTCPVVIGNGSTANHYISIPTTGIAAGILSNMCGSLTINVGSTLDCNTNATSATALGFGTNTTVSSTVGGTGTLRIGFLGFFPAGDFTNFIGSGGGTVEYYGTSTTAQTIPTTYNSPESTTQPLPTYYNLIISPFAGQTMTLPATGLTIYKDFTQSSASSFTGTVVTNTSAQTISVGGNATVAYGTLSLAASADGTANSAATTLSVTGNVVNNGTLSCAAQGTGGRTNIHTITVLGGLTNNGTMNLRQYTSNTQYNVADITFTGSNSVAFGGTGATTLDLVTINKGTSQASTVTCSLSGTLTTTPPTTTTYSASAGTITTWLTLTNGTFDLQYTGVSTPITLSTAAYTIPSTSQLKVTNGTVRITNGTANDLFLNGTLHVAGGTVYMSQTDATGTGGFDIEYAAAGSPTINVSAGSLTVDGSIRRSTATLTGALIYNQAAGTVTVGGTGSNNTRGVFEIEANTGSSFTMGAGSVLNVQRQVGGTGGYTDLFINPSSSSVDKTSTINVGLSSLATNTNFRVNVVPTVGNFTVAGTNAQTVNLYNNLSVGGTLTINSPSTLSATVPNPDANVTVAGDFNCTGTYTGGTNTTTFNGSTNQNSVLTTSTTFYNVTVNKSAGTVYLTGTAPAAPGLNNLSVLLGTLNVGTSSTLKVNHDIIINGLIEGSQAVEVYSTSGTSNTITSSGGTFTGLTLGGTDALARTVTVTGNLNINGALTFNTNRYLVIGSYRLTFGSAATVSGAGTTAFVRTNGVSSDLGVVRNWSSTGTFVYPIGTSTNYTPVSYTLNVSQAGALTVVPVNSAHLTYNQASSERILSYYWIVRRDNSLGITTSANPYVTFSFASSMFTGTGGTLVAAYLDPNSDPLGWTISPASGGTASTTQMTFDSTPTTNLPPLNSFYYYTVGTANTLPSPILPLYSRLAATNLTNLNVGGDWTTASNWTTDADGDPDGNNPSALVPNGVPVVIVSNTRVNTSGNGRRTLKMTINGLLYNGNTTGHSFGVIDGTGTFRTATNTFPAGDFTAFVAATGGTIEYIAPMTMNSMATYNNLSIYSGVSGTVDMAGADLTINGNVNIPTGTTLNNLNNRNVSIAKDWTTNGTFTPGTGTVTFNGSAAQNINGTTTFYGLTVSKTGTDLTLAGTGSTTVTVGGTLTMTNGHLITSATKSLLITGTTSGGSSSSFVSGPVSATLSSGTITLPIGKITPGLYRPVKLANPLATRTWSVEYVGNNPTTDGYPNSTIKTSSGLQSVSRFEYWLVSPNTPTSIDLTLSFGTGSFGGSNVGDIANLRVGHWDGSEWGLPSVDAGSSNQHSSGNDTAGEVTVTKMNTFSPVTLSSTDSPSPLPVELVSFTASQQGSEVLLEWVTESELDNDFFTVHRLNENEGFEKVATVKGHGTTNEKHSYKTSDRYPFAGKNYYRLEQTDFDGTTAYSKIVVVEFTEADEVFKVFPNPVKGSDITVRVRDLKPGQETVLAISNAVGVDVEQVKLTADEHGHISAVLPTSRLSPGIYSVYLRGVGSRYVKKVFVE